MAIAERARDALRPTNSIERVPEPSRGPSLAPPAGELPLARREDKGKPPAYLSEPEGIAKRYYVEDRRGERQYFEDYQRRNLAMRATDTSISSKREDLNTIRAMIEIAEARGWHSVEIRGSGEFKREAWIEASARGLEGRGFTPSDADRQEADRRRSERGHANEVRASEREEAREERAAGHPATAAVHDRHAREAQPGEPAAPTVNDSRRAIRESRRDLSEDGRLMLSALSEKIDRQMNKLNSEAKAEIKAFVGTELVKKERAEGPTVLSPQQRQAATAPERAPAPSAQTPAPARRVEPEAPRRSLGR